MNITFESPNQPEIIALMADLDAYLLGLYPPESVYSLDIASLMQPHIRFAVARNSAGAAAGCGAVLLTPEYAELKRIFVHPSARGAGAAKRLLDKLEQEARTAGCPLMVLETGPDQPEALGLYERHGFARRGPYGDYGDDPLSVFMEKRLR